MKPPWTFECTVTRVVDGDTIELMVDVGFRLTYRDKFRLAHIDAPELKTDKGKAAKAWLENLIKDIDNDPNAGFEVRVIKHGKYRWIGDVGIVENGIHQTTLSKSLVAAGYAKWRKF